MFKEIWLEMKSSSSPLVDALFSVPLGIVPSLKRQLFTPVTGGFQALLGTVNVVWLTFLGAVTIALLGIAMVYAPAHVAANKLKRNRV